MRSTVKETRYKGERLGAGGGTIPRFELMQQAGMTAIVETPVTLFEKPIKTALGGPVESAQMPLGLAPKDLHTVDAMTSFADKRLAVVDSSATNLRHIERPPIA